MTRRKSRIPEHIDIGPYRIPINRHPKISDEKNRPLHGFFSESPDGGYQITIDSSDTGISEADTFFHEVLEAIVTIRDLKVSHSVLQTIAVDLAQALYPHWLERKRKR
jgi:hypothetical protein